MSLRLRFISSVCAALVLSLALGAGITVWQARHSVKTEIDASLLVGRRTVEAEIQTLGSAADSLTQLQRLIGTFSGNRHIRAELVSHILQPAISSVIASTPEQSPDWFTDLISPPPRFVRIDLPHLVDGYSTIMLSTDVHNEALEVWTALRETCIAIAAFSLLAASFIWFSIGRALMPLSRISVALSEIGSGQFGARLAAGSLPETRVISTAFNHMAEELSAVHKRNLELYEELLTTQEAERTEVARDLHDELGPLLLAINIDTSAIERYAISGGNQLIIELTGAIRQTISQLQNEVRAIVTRLRPVGLAEFGLARAIENLVQFWQHRHPEIQFDLALSFDEDSFGGLLDVTTFRIVQEGLVNALRHSNPTYVTISVSTDAGANSNLVVEVVNDGEGPGAVEPGFDLTEMRERVHAAGGALRVGTVPGQGFTVRASLPLTFSNSVQNHKIATMVGL